MNTIPNSCISYCEIVVHYIISIHMQVKILPNSAIILKLIPISLQTNYMLFYDSFPQSNLNSISTYKKVCYCLISNSLHFKGTKLAGIIFVKIETLLHPFYFIFFNFLTKIVFKVSHFVKKTWTLPFLHIIVYWPEQISILYIYQNRMKLDNKNI